MRTLLITRLWIVTGFVAGYAVFHPGWRQSGPLEDEAATSFRKIVEHQSALPDMTPKERIDRLLEVCRKPDGLARDNAMYEAIQALQPSDFLVALADWPTLGIGLEKIPDEMRRNLLESAIKRWLELDEAGALGALKRVNAMMQTQELALSYTGVEDLAVVCTVLARRNPRWLFKQLPSIGYIEQASVAIEALLQESAQSNPAETRGWLETFRGTQRWFPALAAYSKGLAYSDPRAAMELAAKELKDDSRERKKVMEAAYLTGVLRAPSASTHLLEMFTPEERTGMVWQAIKGMDEKGDPLTWFQEQVAAYPELLKETGGVALDSLELLVERDPERTVEWFRKFPASEQSLLLSSALEVWGDINPTAAFDWLTAQSVESLPAELSFFGKCVLANPERFQKWTATLPPGTLRESAQLHLAVELVREKRMEEALRYFPAELKSTKNLRQTKALFHAMPESDLPAAAALISRLAPGQLQASAASGLLDTWTLTSPKAAAQWVESLPEGAARDASLGTLAGSFARVDAESATLWLAGIRDIMVWKEAVGAIFDRWNMQEPRRAREWLNQLPGMDAELKTTLLRRSR